MKTRVAVSVFAVLLGVASIAHAAQLLSPPYFTRVRATNITTKGACVIRNTGTAPVTVNVSLFSNNSVVGEFDFCNGHALGGGQTCLVSAFLPDDSYVACKVTAPNVTNLRGTLEFAESPSHGFDVFLGEDF